MTYERYVTPSELRSSLNISRSTLRRLVEKGCPHIWIRTARRFAIGEVLAWLQEQHKTKTE